MTHKAHDLATEFPNDVELLHNLKMTNGHFNTLAERYQEANHAIIRIEAELDAASDVRLEDMKKERLSLLDQIGVLLRDARQETA
jgi:uncharacterized protein YdcH (DUF465 family)